jgi:hypothetical protein
MPTTGDVVGAERARLAEATMPARRGGAGDRT